MATPLPHNHAETTLSRLLFDAGGELAREGTLEADGAVRGVSTDTRRLAPGAAFVALVGDSFDGHDHLEAAARAGAVVAVVERDVGAPPGLALVRVRSTLEALGALARAHARRWRALGGERILVAITGSAGKTTTRVALAALLERLAPGQVHAAAGNLNNLVGAPMVLLGLMSAHRYAVVELGTNRPGEIARLAALTEPEVAVLTLVASAHVEGLGSIEGVAEEKGELFRALRPEGVAVGNVDDPRVRAALESAPCKRRAGYGASPGADYRIGARRPEGLECAHVELERGGERLSFSTPLLGEAGALACAAAVAVAEAGLGLRVDAATAGLSFAAADVGGGAGRLVPRRLASGLVVIDDSYNANPASTCASIRAAAEIARANGRRLVLVLGEMRELGKESSTGHDAVGREAGKSGADEVLAVFGAARRIADRAAEAGAAATFVATVDEAARRSVELARPTDLVLVKGSRGLALERVVARLVEVHDGGAAGARSLS